MTNIEITQNFIENLEKVREELGWTQAQMAEKLQMSHSSYNIRQICQNPYLCCLSGLSDDREIFL